MSEPKNSAPAQLPARRGPGGGPMHAVPVKPKNAKGTLRRLLRYLSGSTGRLILVLVLCVVTAAVSIVTTRMNGMIIDDYIAVGDLSGL